MSGVISTSPRGYLTLLNRLILSLTLVYVLTFAILCIPAVQRHAAFQHSVRLPFYPRFDLLEKYGFAPGKATNLYLQTSDNETLGAWFVLSEPFYHSTALSSTSPPTPLSPYTIRTALQTHPTVLFFHGAAASRAMPRRIALCTMLSSRLHTNVLMIDYRGFGDSTGAPTEAGLALDAYAAWTWLTAQGAKPEDIVILGHSLGTGVSGMLVSRLREEGIKPRGVALMAPFTALKTLIQSYDLWGLPLLLPFQTSAWGRALLTNLLHLEIDTLAVIQDFHVPLFIAHATNDNDVPHIHSRTLIDRLLDSVLVPSASLPSDHVLEYTIPTPHSVNPERQKLRESVVKKTEVPNFGVIEEFEGGGGKIVYVESMWGSHVDVALHEGVQDEAAKLFGLGWYYRNETT